MSRLPITPLYFFTFLLFSWLLTGCEGDSKAFISTIDAAKNKVVSIELTPTTEENVIIEVGQSQAFAVKATRKDGSTYTVDNKKLVWSVSCDQGNCGSINQNGVLSTSRNSASGKTTVTARYSSFSDSSTIEVSNAELLEITIKVITPEPINLCQSIELEAMGIYDDGSKRNITSADGTKWQIIGDEGNARLVKDQGQVFLSTSTKDDVNVQASRNALSGNTVTSTDGLLKVEGDFPNSISVTPQTAIIDLGATQQYKAIGTWPNLPVSETITNNVDWASDNNALSFSTITAGLAKGESVYADTIGILASCGAGSETGTATASVQKRVISSLKIQRKDGVSPYKDNIYRMSKDSLVSFVAYAVYENGDVSTNDLSQQANWDFDPDSAGDTNSIKIGRTPDASETEDKRGNITGKEQTDPALGNAYVRVLFQVEGPKENWPAGYFYVEVE